MVERFIARSLSIESIETQILRFCSGDIGSQNMLLEFQRSPRAFITCMEIINRHCNEQSPNSIPLILFCSQTLVECDHIYSLCRLVSVNSINSKNLSNIDIERRDTITQLEQTINSVAELNKANPQFFPSIRFLLRTWLRLKLFDNWNKRIPLEIMQFVNIFKPNRQFQVEILSILAQEICNDRFILNISQRNELAKNCISQSPIVFKFLGVNDLSIASVYSDWINLHVKYLDSLVDDGHCELPSDVDSMVKSSLSTFISLKLIDRLFDQSPLPIHTITNLINLCPLDINSKDAQNPLVEHILNLIISNLSKLYKLQSPLFKTTSPILLSLSYGHLPYLIEYHFNKDIDYILDGSIAILSRDDYNTRDVMVNFWINLNRNLGNKVCKITQYLQKIVVVFYEIPILVKNNCDFDQIYSFRESASTLLYEIATRIGHKFIFNIVESKLKSLNDNTNLAEKNSISLCEIESIFFILSSISKNCEFENDGCIPMALGLLNRLKYTYSPISLLLAISIGRLILLTAEYTGKRSDLFDSLFTCIFTVLLPLILRIKNNSSNRDYLIGENILMDALLALSRTCRKIVDDVKEVKKYLNIIYNISRNVQFSIENRIKAVNSAGAIISYVPIQEMKILFSELIDNLSNDIKTSSNPNDYIQLYLIAIQSVRPMPDSIESETTILKIIEKHTSVMELLFTSPNEKIIERLSQVLIVVNIISRNHSESFTIFNWTLKLLSHSFRSSHPIFMYSALRSIIINSIGHSINWSVICNSLLPSLAILKDSIILSCTSERDKNILQINNIGMEHSSLQLLSTPDGVNVCMDCIDISLNHPDLISLLLVRSEFIIFFESLLVILPFIIHPRVLFSSINLIKTVVSIEDQSDSKSIYAKKIRLLQIISQRYSKSLDEMHTITFKIVIGILTALVSGTCGVEIAIDIISETMILLLNDCKTREDARNAIDSFFDLITDPLISPNVKFDCRDKLKLPNSVLQSLIQLEGWKLWKRRIDLL